MATAPRKRKARKKVDASELTRRVGRLVDALRNQPERNVTLADVAGVTEVLIASLDRYMSSIDTSLYRECQVLSSHIAQTRSEIADLKPKDLAETRIPRAGQELDAIVEATEKATGEIMSVAEELMAADDSDVAVLKATIEAGCLRIFEACAFQDITGQRIAKVVTTLSFIEERLGHLQRIFGDALGDAPGKELADAPEEEKKSVDELLLNGPALAGEGIDQSDVDALMNNAATASPSSAAAEPPSDSLNGGAKHAAPAEAASPKAAAEPASDSPNGSAKHAAPAEAALPKAAAAPTAAPVVTPAAALPDPNDLNAKIDALFR